MANSGKCPVKRKILFCPPPVGDPENRTTHLANNPFDRVVSLELTAEFLLSCAGNFFSSRYNAMRWFLRLSFVLFALPAFAGGGPLTVTNIASGSSANQTLFQKSDGSVWGMGNQMNYFTYLTADLAHTPRLITASNVTAMAVGLESYLLLKSDGTVWGYGRNLYGELCDVIGPLDKTPLVQLPLTNVIAIAAGSGQSLFVEADGSLWGVGNDTSGQLGDGQNYFFGGVPKGPNHPEKIVSSGVTKVAAGGNFSLFLKVDGSLWGMGEDPVNPEASPGSDFVNTNIPVELVASNVTAIAAGGEHALFLRTDGSLWGMGYNLDGQLGDGTHFSTKQPEMIMASNVTAIAAGYNLSVFLKSDGSMWVMGGDSFFFVSGSSWYTSFTFNTNLPEMIEPSNVVAIAAGQSYVLYTKSDGTLWGVGNNSDSQLGDGFYGIMGDTFYDVTAIPEQLVPPPPPVLTETVSADGNLQFSATCGFGGNFYLLAGTNLAQPFSQWTPVWTNVITDRSANTFSAVLTNGAALSGHQFFILESD